jgi:hypothetical protein
MRALPVALLLCLAGCTLHPPVSIEYNAATDFTKFKSYSWVHETPPPRLSGPLNERLRASLNRSLTAHGYHAGDPGQFSVDMVLYAQERIQVAGSGAMGGDYISSDWAEPVLWSSIERSVHEQEVYRAILVIFMFDTTTKERIWRGIVSTTVKPADFTEPVINKLVDAAVAQFPPDIRCTETAGRYEPCNIQ